MPGLRRCASRASARRVSPRTRPLRSCAAGPRGTSRGWSASFSHALEALKADRQGDGRWRRFPFYFTVAGPDFRTGVVTG